MGPVETGADGWCGRTPLDADFKITFGVLTQKGGPVKDLTKSEEIWLVGWNTSRRILMGGWMGHNCQGVMPAFSL